MKKIKLNGKLSLNKETVSNLTDSQMKSVNGGAWFTLYHCRSNNCPTNGCPTGTCTCPTLNNCPAPTEGGSVCQSACGGNACP